MDRGHAPRPTGPGSTEADYIDWLTIRDSRQSVIDDVQRIRNHPLVPARITIHGYLYDVRSGHFIDVQGADDPEHASVTSPVVV